MTGITKISGSFVETEIDDEVVLMRLSDGDFFSLEGTARAVWLAIDGTRDREAIARELAESFDAPLDAVLADCARFLDDLAAAGLISA
jgi:hypothetical protein